MIKLQTNVMQVDIKVLHTSEVLHFQFKVVMPGVCNIMTKPNDLVTPNFSYVLSTPFCNSSLIIASLFPICHRFC
jgi:hypothetical protein